MISIFFPLLNLVILYPRLMSLKIILKLKLIILTSVSMERFSRDILTLLCMYEKNEVHTCEVHTYTNLHHSLSNLKKNCGP